MSVHGENGPTIRISSPLSVPSRPGIPAYKSRQRVGRVPTRRHVSCSSGPASPPSWTLGLPHVQWHRIPPPSEGGLWYRHVSSGSGPCLTAREGFDTAMCLMAPDPASQPGRASVQPRRSQLYTPASFCRGLRRCHIAYGPLRAAGHKHKEIVSWLVCAARPASSQGERVGSQDTRR
jgi:hypothetical protein